MRSGNREIAENVEFENVKQLYICGKLAIYWELVECKFGKFYRDKLKGQNE